MALHALGKAQVPLTPKHVVSLVEPVTDNLLALGVQPVGTVVTDAGTDIVNSLQPQLEGALVVGTLAEPNLEAILSSSPDLILAGGEEQADLYEQFARIAPTVFSEDPYAAHRGHRPSRSTTPGCGSTGRVWRPLPASCARPRRRCERSSGPPRPATARSTSTDPREPHLHG